ncbi:MAG: hypothetical protein EOO53_05515 [Gammaproteobacteria bacterium]|nr:MAG: hypothetical protein EOO53_05515 [Gammaproteobacteria bacterium]
MEFFNLKFTDHLAIYGALLSTLVFLWNVTRAIPRIKVKLIFGLEKVHDDYEAGVFIFVQNPSSSAVHLSNISILYPYAKVGIVARLSHIFKYGRIPKHLGWVHSSLSNYHLDNGNQLSLDPGKSHKVFLSKQILDAIFQNGLRRELIASVQDQLWNTTYSAKFQVIEPTK